MTLEANSNLVVGQWADSPRLRAAIDAPIDTIREDVLPAFERLALMHDIEHAEGVWLDYLGVRVGIDRPVSTEGDQEGRFGFDDAGVGFDQGPFRGTTDVEGLSPLPDAIFRRFVKARAILVLGDGTCQTFVRAVREIDPTARVTDRRDMTIRVITSRRSHMLLADEIGALPRTAGVKVEYAARGVFGFDDAGVGFDRGPFRTSAENP